MDSVIASFAFDTRNTDTYHYEGWCYGMPGVCFRTLGANFVPDYSIFFLSNYFYLDELTIEEVHKRPAFSEHRLLFEALAATGRLKVVNYRQHVDPYEEMILAGVEHDIRNIDEWSAPFLELTELWRELELLATKKLHQWPSGSELEADMRDVLHMLSCGMVGGINTHTVRNSLKNWKGKVADGDREYTRRAVVPFLKHISATLCLSDCLGASVHDWADVAPLYKKKLVDSLRTRDAAALERDTQCRQLIRLMFPHFKPRSASALAKALDDKRIEALRRLVDQAVSGNLKFDEEFANRTLRDVLHQEEKLGKARNIAGWIVTPVAFVPWLGHAMEKGTEVLIDRALESRFRQRNEWFFWLSEIDRN